MATGTDFLVSASFSRGILQSSRVNGPVRRCPYNNSARLAAGCNRWSTRRGGQVVIPPVDALGAGGGPSPQVDRKQQPTARAGYSPRGRALMWAGADLYSMRVAPRQNRKLGAGPQFQFA